MTDTVSADARRPILVTVFEPFDKARVNASREVGLRLAARDARLELLELPVARGVADALLIARLSDESQPAPRLVVALGEAGPLPRTVRLEKVAINWDDYRIADNAGNQPRDEPIHPNGAAAYFSTLPVFAIAESLKDRTPLKVVVSLTAGSFLCNRVSYVALDWLAARPICPFFFVHVPAWRPARGPNALFQAALRLRSRDYLSRLVATVAAIIDEAAARTDAPDV